MRTPAAAELRQTIDRNVPVIVLRRSLGLFQHCPLAIARSLGRLGVPVHCVSCGPDEAATRSRYLTGTFELNPDLPPERWVEEVLALADRVPGAILLPIDDLAAISAADHRARLLERFRLPPWPDGVHRRLASKLALHELCRELGLDTPTCSVAASEDDLLGAAAATGYPLVLKRIDPWRATRDPHAPSVCIAHDSDQARRAHEGMGSDERPEVMVQEYIPGDSDSVWMFNGYVATDGRLACGFTGRKLRQRGPRTGPTTLGECWRNEAVAAAAETLLRALEYRGIVDMGFRYDARDGRYKLLDVNPRLGSTFRLFTAEGGLDVVRALHLDLTSRPVPASRCREGRRWIDERSDPVTALRLAREGSLGLAAWVGTLRAVDETAWWAADDPRPFALMCAHSWRPALRRATASMR